MSSPFDDCRKRVERAEAHREAGSKLWNDFIEKGDIYDISLGIDPNGTGVLSVVPVTPFPEDIPLEIGEMLYQLRAALDGCIYQAAILETGKNPPPDEQKLEFPICDSFNKFKEVRWKLGPLTQQRIDLVQAIQPYNTPEGLPLASLPFNFNRAIGIINDWARKDRHRKLHITGSWIVGNAPMFRAPEGATITNVKTLPNGFFLEKENEIAIFDIEGYVEGMQVQANPNLAIDIAIDEIPAPCSPQDTLGIRALANHAFLSSAASTARARASDGVAPKIISSVRYRPPISHMERPYCFGLSFQVRNIHRQPFFSHHSTNHGSLTAGSDS